MYELSERIKDLAVKYLVAETRTYGGALDREKQVRALVYMIEADHISNIFDFVKDNYGRERECKDQFERLLANRNEQTISWANNEKRTIFEQVIKALLSKTEDEAQAKGAARDEWRLKKQIEDLRAQVEFGKPAHEVTLWNRLNSRVNIPYLIILFLVVVLLGGLVLIGMTATMTVNVEFSVGEIIGALLVGTGVAAAGVSYATRDKEKRQIDNE
jgi:hypothetical protein